MRFPRLRQEAGDPGIGPGGVAGVQRVALLLMDAPLEVTVYRTSHDIDCCGPFCLMGFALANLDLERGLPSRSNQPPDSSIRGVWAGVQLAARKSNSLFAAGVLRGTCRHPRANPRSRP